MTTPPRERGGFLGDACLSPATLPPTGPVRASRFRERGFRAPHGVSCESIPALSGWLRPSTPGLRRFEYCITGSLKYLLTFTFFIIGGRAIPLPPERGSPLARN